ncbi:MAG: response regulator transcription factor [Pseudomonadota bacterium]
MRRLVAEFLAREGLEVEEAADADAMDAVLARRRPDLIVLDLMLPGEDGLSICRRLRAAGGPAILMLTAKSDEIDRVVGLEMGADDYLTKPFGPRELLARIRAILRRSRVVAKEQPAGETLWIDGLKVDLPAREVIGRNGDPLDLSSAEFDLFATLCEAPGRVLSRDHLLDRVFGRSATPFDRSIDVLVSRLRKKVEETPDRPTLIKTVRNAGYVLAVRKAGDEA